MCLSIVGQVIRTSGAAATDDDERADQRVAEVDVNGRLRRVNIGLLDEVAVGDWVLVHLGYATARLDPAEARRTRELLEEFSASS